MTISDLSPTILAQAVATAAPVSAVHSSTDSNAPPIKAQHNSGSYHIVYTASTGCFGNDGVSGRHNLSNMLMLSKEIPVDYINTNFQSEQVGPEWAAATTPRDARGNPVPGNQIATIAEGGHSGSEATQLGWALLGHYNLGISSTNVALVLVTDPKNRQKDRVVDTFDSTFASNFVEDVRSAIRADKANQQQGRTGAQR